MWGFPEVLSCSMCMLINFGVSVYLFIYVFFILSTQVYIHTSVNESNIQHDAKTRSVGGG